MKPGTLVFILSDVANTEPSPVGRVLISLQFRGAYIPSGIYTRPWGGNTFFFHNEYVLVEYLTPLERCIYGVKE